ncbi:TNF receptor-associated factor 4-like [Dysidea avara]|uniref:TNF receptor-associated factor 4-like n=1 Tax=Dysidea avara TaxID=196820 RepID=UPI00331B038C
MSTISPSEIGGYEQIFIDTPHERYMCKICIHPCQDAYLSGCCGHNFCKSCLDTLKKTAKTCPCCRNEDFVTVINKQADREIRSLHVICTNKERGCEWQGELNYINNHLQNIDGCQFEDVKCSNECGKMLQRQYLASHVETECPNRQVECQDCHISGGNQFIEGEHKEQCPKLPLPCPNSCKVSCPPLSRRKCGKRRARSVTNAIQYFPRDEIDAHRKECPLEMVQCLNECEEVLQRRYLTRHLQNLCSRRKVDCQHCHITGEYKFIKDDHEEKCPKRPLPCPNNCEVETILHEDMEAHRKECPLEMVQCEYHNVGCEERMMRERKWNHEEEKMEEHLLMTKLKLFKTEDKLVKNEGILVTTEARLNSLEVMVHRLINNTGSSIRLIKSAQWSNHLSTLSTKVTGVTQICTVTVKMSKFADHKERDLGWFSEPFYSHNRGYKMNLQIYAGGHSDGKGTHLSVFLYLMKGPYDDELTWPLRGTFEVKLLNQMNDCDHYLMTLRYGDNTPDPCASRLNNCERQSGWGNRQFISNEVLCKVTPTCQFLKEDCIFIKVIKL